MRRKEKQITDKQELETILRKATLCHLAMSTENQPYVVPLCFGYQSDTLYFHSAAEGKKLEMLRQNPKVSFAIELNNEIVKAKDACNWGMNYLSLIGSGEAFFLDDETERINALDLIMEQYSTEKWIYKPGMLKKTILFKVKISELTGKKSGN